MSPHAGVHCADTGSSSADVYEQLVGARVNEQYSRYAAESTQTAAQQAIQTCQVTMDKTREIYAQDKNMTTKTRVKWGDKYTCMPVLQT